MTSNDLKENIEASVLPEELKGVLNTSVDYIEDVYDKGNTAENNKYPTIDDMFKGYYDKWHTLQTIESGGFRTDYANVFEGYVDEEFNPLYYHVTPTSMNSMFKNSKITDMHNRMKISTNNCTDFTNAFANSTIIEVEDIDCSSVTEADNFNGVFKNCKYLRKIGTIKMLPDISLNETFIGAYNLEEVRFSPYVQETSADGATIHTIGIGNDIDFRDCPKLSSTSVVNILDALVRDENNIHNIYFSINLSSEAKTQIRNYGDIDGWKISYELPIIDLITDEKTVAELMTDMYNNVPDLYKRGRLDVYKKDRDFAENSNMINCAHYFSSKESAEANSTDFITYTSKTEGKINRSNVRNYKVKPHNAFSMFKQSEKIDVINTMELDTSNAVTVNAMFLGSKIEHIGTIDLKNLFDMPNYSNIYMTFANDRVGNSSPLKKIDNIIFYKNRGTTYTAFRWCENLEEVTFTYNTFNDGYTGDVTWDYINLSWSPKLTKNSIQSLTNALLNRENLSSGQCILSKTAFNNNFGKRDNQGNLIPLSNGEIDLTDEGKSIIDTIQNKNWTLSLLDSSLWAYN